MKKKSNELELPAKEEALRYLDNAREVLKKAGSEDNDYYSDPKYVKMACGTAYSGVLIALDQYLKNKGIKKSKGRKSETYYRTELGKIDRKLLNHYNAAYDILHLSGYYDGNKVKKVIETGFEVAKRIIDWI